MLACRIDEDAAHQLSRYAKELSTVFPLDAVYLHELQKDFIHECRRLQAMISTLGRHVVVRKTVEFPVDQRD